MKKQQCWVQVMGGSSYVCDYAENAQRFASMVEARRWVVQFWQTQPCSHDVKFWVYQFDPLNDRSGRDYPNQEWTRTRNGGVRVEVMA